MNVLCNGVTLPVYDWLIREHYRGEWRGRITVGNALPVTEGDRVLIDGVWYGTAERVSAMGALTEAEIVGGAGGLDVRTRPRQYAGTTKGAVLSDLCADAEETAAEDATEVGAWRARGAPLRIELYRLSPLWRVLPSGVVTLLQAQEEAPLPGQFLRASGDARTYALGDGATPLAGKTLGGATVETAVYTRGTARPSVTTWPLRRAPVTDNATVGGTITYLSGGRASVDLDNGETLSDVPLFSAAGYVPEGAEGVRVVVIDVAEDASNTIALVGADGTTDEVSIAQGTGRVLRSGDRIAILGLVSGAPGAPVVSPPAAVIVSLDPTITTPGAPGIGFSRVKG